MIIIIKLEIQTKVYGPLDHKYNLYLNIDNEAKQRLNTFELSHEEVVEKVEELKTAIPFIRVSDDEPNRHLAKYFYNHEVEDLSWKVHQANDDYILDLHWNEDTDRYDFHVLKFDYDKDYFAFHGCFSTFEGLKRYCETFLL